jgi:hypothetical protein
MVISSRINLTMYKSTPCPQKERNCLAGALPLEPLCQPLKILNEERDYEESGKGREEMRIRKSNRGGKYDQTILYACMEMS